MEQKQDEHPTFAQMEGQSWSEADNYKGLHGELKSLDADFMDLLKNPAIRLQEGKIGQYEIKIELVPAGKEMTVVSQRNWLMMGYKPLKVIFDKPRLLYKLLRDKQGLMMSDSPQEMFLQYEAYKNAKGRILVGGLGLGMYATMVAKKNEVTEVVVVEIDEDIIKLCKPHNAKVKVIHDDIWRFIKTTNEKFDYAYVDIHYHTGCMEYIQTVLPMRKLFEERFPATPIDFWGEEEMRAQYNPDFDKGGWHGLH